MQPTSDRHYRCFCGLCHATLGTRILLVVYVCSSALSVNFGLKSTLTWCIVPLVVVVFAVYGIVCNRHKYLYPFFVVSLVHSIVCVFMALLIFFFSISNFQTMSQTIGHSLDISHPTPLLSSLVIGATVCVSLILAAFHLYQSVVIYRSLQYYEEQRCKYDDCNALKPRMFESHASDSSRLL